MYLLDTNVLSEARRGSPEAVAWLSSVRSETLAISVITIGEIAKGIALKGRTDRATAARLTEWLTLLRQDHANRILPVSDAVALEWGRIASLRPRGDGDGLIAATAIVHELILVTRNVQHFADLPLQIIDPWSRDSLPKPS